MKNNLIKLGSGVKRLRKEKKLTLAELSKRTGLTAGLLSKIENFRTIPSLPVLMKIASALETTPSVLLAGIENSTAPKWILSKKGDREAIDREESVGFNYEDMLNTSIQGFNLQVMSLSIKPGSQREKVTSEGEQLIFLIEGKIDFILEDEKIPMAKGDLLFFDGRAPHVPENTGKKNANLLAIYLLPISDN